MTDPPANRDRVLVATLRQLAGERGIACESFSQDWLLRLEKDARVSHVYGYNFELNSATARMIATDKAAVSDLLQHAGVPRVEHRLVLHPRLGGYVGSGGNWQAMVDFARDHDFRVVVKPNEGTSGEGVTRAMSPIELEQAVHRLFERNRALALSPLLEIEHEYRCLLLAGECRLLYSKDRPFVLGDGTSSVAELLQARARGRQGAAGYDPAAVGKLERVPAAGERVLLQWRHNLGTGAVPRPVESGALRERLIALATRAAQVLQLELASIDVVQVGGELSILEANTGIMVESYARTAPDGPETARRIYGEILDRIFGA